MMVGYMICTKCGVAEIWRFYCCKYRQMLHMVGTIVHTRVTAEERGRLKRLIKDCIAEGDKWKKKKGSLNSSMDIQEVGKLFIFCKDDGGWLMLLIFKFLRFPQIPTLPYGQHIPRKARMQKMRKLVQLCRTGRSDLFTSCPGKYWVNFYVM